MIKLLFIGFWVIFGILLLRKRKLTVKKWEKHAHKNVII